jgi:hypothetical protein
MNITGSSLALWWRARPLPDGDLLREPDKKNQIEQAKT